MIDQILSGFKSRNSKSNVVAIAFIINEITRRLFNYGYGFDSFSFEVMH